MSTKPAQPTFYPSYARWYWLLWCVMFVVFVSFTFVFPIERALGWFAVAEGLLGAGVYHFEYGRFIGYLKSNYPQRITSMEFKFLYRFVDFFHPALWREVFSSHPDTSTEYNQVRNTFRTAYIFCWVTILVPMSIVWSGLYSLSNT